MKKIYLFALAGAALLLSVVAFAQSFSALKGKDFAEKQPALTKMVSLQSATIPNRAPVAHRAIASVDELVGNYVSISKQYGYTKESGLQPAAVPLNGVSTTITKIDDTHIGITGFVTGATDAVTAEVNLSEGTLTIADGQTLFTHATYGPITMANSSEEAGTPLTATITDNGIVINEIWCDLIGGDGTYAGYLWSGYYFIGTTLVKSNGVMQYKNASEANNNGPANVYVEQKDGVATVYNFANQGYVVNITLNANMTVAIPSQMVNEGSTKTGAYYTYGVDVENKKLLAEIAGTGTANVLTFPGTWTFYSVNQYWYNYYTETSITLNEGSTFTYPALDIEISPETGADISAAITAAQGAAERLGNVTVTLAEGGAYTITAPINSTASVAIKGAKNAKIDASGLTDAMIKLVGSSTYAQKTDGTNSTYLWYGNIVVKDVEISGLKKQLVKASENARIDQILLENSVVEMAAQVNVFDLGAAFYTDLTINKSTIWGTTATNHKNYLIKTDGRCENLEKVNNVYPKDVTTSIINSTLYNIARDQKLNNSNGHMKGKTYNVEKMENSILVNVGTKTGNEVNGWCFGTNSANMKMSYKNNTYITLDAEDNVANVNGWTAADKTGSDQSNTSLTTNPGITYAKAEAGDFTIGASTAQAKMKTGDPRWLVDYVAPETSVVENIVLDAAAGDITAQLNAKVAEITNKLNSVGNITINLTADAAYTVSGAIEASASVAINGNGATIDASQLTGNGLINYTTVVGAKAMKDETTESAYTIVENVTIKDVVINGLKKSIINSAASKVLFKNILVSNAVVEMAGNVNVFGLAVGYPENLKIEKSTIWSNGVHKSFFFKADGKPADINATATTTWTVDQSTLVNIAIGKKANNSNGGIKGKPTTEMILTNSLLYNFGSNNGNEVNGWLWGQNGGAKSTYANNAYLDANGTVAGWTAADKGGSDQTNTSVVGTMTFEDAAAGKFNGTLLTEDEPAASPVAVGDPRWTIEAKKDVYSKSLNIEQLVLDKTTKADIAAILAEKYIEISSNAGLDSLNDEKTLRNEPFLGLKIKAADATVKVLVKKGQVLNVKFGCVNDPVNVAINGTPIDTQVAKNTEGSVFTLPAAEADQEVVFTTTTKNTVVLKQIMIGEDIAAVTLPAATKYQVSVAEGIENGTVEFDATSMTDSKGYKTVKVGDEVTITATPAEGYELETLTVKGVISNEAIVVTDGKFIMPADAVTINATFKEIPKLYIIGDMNGWNRTAMTEMTFNAETQAYEYEYAPTAIAYLAFADKQMTEAEAAADENWSVFNANRYAPAAGSSDATLNTAMTLQKGVDGSIVLKPVKEGTSYKISVAKDFSAVTISGEAAPEPSEDTYIIAGSSAALLGTEWDGTNEANKLTLNETTGLYEKTYEGVTLAKGTIEFKIVKNGTTWIPDGMGNNHTCEIPADGVYTVKVTFNAANPEKVDDYEMVATPATGINGVKADALKDAQIYNLQGVRVDKAQKGLYIVNGRKVVIK